MGYYSIARHHFEDDDAFEKAMVTIIGAGWRNIPVIGSHKIINYRFNKELVVQDDFVDDAFVFIKTEYDSLTEAQREFIRKYHQLPRNKDGQPNSDIELIKFESTLTDLDKRRMHYRFGWVVDSSSEILVNQVKDDGSLVLKIIGGCAVIFASIYVLIEFLS